MSSTSKSLFFENLTMVPYENKLFEKGVNELFENVKKSMTATAIVSSASTFSNSAKIKYAKPLIFADFFSPNGDGHNDFFHVENLEEYPINKMFIFNRWGETVYVSEPYNNDWDGRGQGNFLGNFVPEGTYFYMVEAIDASGNVQKFAKSLTIAR